MDWLWLGAYKEILSNNWWEAWNNLQYGDIFKDTNSISNSTFVTNFLRIRSWNKVVALGLVGFNWQGFFPCESVITTSSAVLFLGIRIIYQDYFIITIFRIIYQVYSRVSSLLHFMVMKVQRFLMCSLGCFFLDLYNLIWLCSGI